METRSIQHSHGRNVNSLGTASLISISLILSDPSCIKQNTIRPSTHNNINNTLLANTVVVSTSVSNSYMETNSNTKFNHTCSRSKREFPTISMKQNSYVSDMEGLRQKLSLQEVSEEITQLIANSRRQSTLGNYESARRKRSGWCDSWKVDSF